MEEKPLNPRGARSALRRIQCEVIDITRGKKKKEIFKYRFSSEKIVLFTQHLYSVESTRVKRTKDTVFSADKNRFRFIP